jgi:hypothetical protein
MGFFSIIETFFFISLGITILLVALLVYHFKQRLSAVEQKYESLFDIVTGVVNQLSNIQSVSNASLQQTQFMGQPGGIYQPWMEPGHLGNINVSPEYHHQMFSGEHVQYNMSDEPQINYSVEESEEEESDDEESDEEESEEEESDDEESDDEESDDSQQEEAKVIVSDDDEDESQVGVKIINLHMDEPSIHIEDFNINPIALDDTDDAYELPTQDVQIDYSVSLEQDQETPIVVRKMEDSLQEQPESTFVIEKASSVDLYKKMTLSNLKATVISKGLCSDPSKMKKNELLKLLEECE